MDSTFLGVFAGFGLLLGNPDSLCLFYLSDDNLKAFAMLGLEHIASTFSAWVENEHEPFPAADQFHLLPGSDLARQDQIFDAIRQATLMLECHEDLCRIDEKNEPKFHDVKQFLREDIARHGARP
jgi:hypothetical protein